MKETYDTLNSYCRMLGHPVPFRYCRSVNQDLPCRNVVACWSVHFSVEDFISSEYSPSEREMIFAPAPHKLVTLMSIMQKAREKT